MRRKHYSVISLSEVLNQMGKTYRSNPIQAVRGQSFITYLHKYVGEQIESRLTEFARRRGVKVIYEATILGSTKPKDVDVTVVDPENGPLLIIGVRSQMSSVGKNVLTYYEEIVGECKSLQDRYPMCTFGYIYLHPLKAIKSGKEKESIDHTRYAQMYAAVTGRTGKNYKFLNGIFDQFAYMVVDFDKNPPMLCDSLIKSQVKDVDLSVTTFIDRIVNDFKSRMLFWDILK